MSVSFKRLRRSGLGLIALIMFLSSLLSSLAFVKTVSAAPSFGLRWTNNVGVQYGWGTTIAPLAADLFNNGKMEIVVTLGPSEPTGSAGLIAALDADTGGIVWVDTSANISTLNLDDHCPFEIADLKGDGSLEIVVATWSGPLVLYGNGSLYWRRTDVPSGNRYFALCDINGDGHPEIFVSSANGPYSGYDYLTCLSYSGQVIYQGWSWYPCWGGLTVGDPIGNGKFIVFQADRSSSACQVSPTSIDPYTGGGMGLHAYDAFTLKLLWSDSIVLCSSQVPVLADVDKNGGLEVIVADQLDNGIVVLNASDGTVDTTNGIYRSGSTGMPAHSQPTVYDIDGDGNLELIDCNNSPVQIWDLYNWRPKATLPFSMSEPPKLGRVTADGRMDIICPVNNSIYIYSFDNNSGTYTQTASATVPYESGTNAFTLVQDVDGDGYNELFLTSARYVYCFNTPGPAQHPQPRSGVQFYSECRCGAAVYLPPFKPSAPVLRDEQPQDGAVNQTFNPLLTIRATSFQDKAMTGTFGSNATGTWKNIGSFSGPKGLYSASTSGMNSPGTTYYWTVTCNDGSRTTTQICSFTTHSDPPTQGTPILTNDGSNNLTCSNQTTSDPNNDPVANIYNWQVNGTSLDTLNLPFDTRTTNNPLVFDNLTFDGFENGFAGWNGNGVPNWDQNSAQKHSGTYSAHAGAGDLYLTSNDLDTSGVESLTVSFWYRDHGFGSSNTVSLQFWNGIAYNSIFAFTIANPSETWQWYSIQTFSSQYLIHNFRVRFSASGIGTGDFWLDDFAVTCPARTEDYSGFNNYGTLHNVAWTPSGVQGGAYVFNGISSYIRVNDNPSLGGDGTWSEISVEFWIKPLSNQNGAGIIAKRDPTVSDVSSSYMVGFEAGGTPNTLYWGINNGTGWQETSSGATVLAAGTVYDVVCTYKSGTGLTIYINGTQRVNVPLTGNILQSKGVYLFGAPLFIGSDGSDSQTSWLNGILDEVHIYSRALSSAQVLQRYLDTKDRLCGHSATVWQETKTGGPWSCQVTPNDSFGDGQTKLSNTVSTPSAEDIAIVSIEPQRTTIPAGSSVSFNATVKNHGGYSATWNVSFDINDIYVPVARDFTLQVDMANGWNHTMPGPTISVVQGDLVNLTLQSGDWWYHQFYVDYANDSLLDSDEPASPMFTFDNITFSFTANFVGNFTYYDAYYQSTMFGLLIVSPPPHQTAQIGSDSIELDGNQSATLTVLWNTIGFAIGKYAVNAYAWPVPDETDTADNSFTSPITVMVTPPIHGVAITNVIASKTIVGQGYDGNIMVTIQNEGDQTENVNVTVNANATSIQSLNVTVSSGNPTNVTFTGNTIGLACGNYTIWASALPVNREANTTDNSCTGGQITVTIPGDINGDLKVGLSDLVALAQAYSSKPEGSNWNPNADIDGNGTVGLSDLVIMAQHYGQHYP